MHHLMRKALPLAFLFWVVVGVVYTIMDAVL